MDLKMTINDIEEKLYNYKEYTFYLNGYRGFNLHHSLGTVLDSSDGIYLIGNYFQGDIAQGVELTKFLSFFHRTRVLMIDLGDEELEYIYKLHGFADDFR